MNIKTTLLTCGLTVAIIAMPMSAYAQTTTPTTIPGKSGRLATLNTLCQNAVSMRLTSLNDALTRINGLKKLSSSQKQQYVSEIQSDISGLQGVQTQCTTDFNAGNLTNLRNDYHSVFLQYRVYAEFLPQVRLLIASDTMGYTVDLLNQLATKLQSRIQAQGNPSNLTSLLADMQAKLTDANTQYTNVESLVSGLTPSGYDQNPTGTTSTLQTARADIKQGVQDIKTALSDAQQIRQGLKPVATTTPTPTP
jgi:hypothetical protein